MDSDGFVSLPWVRWFPIQDGKLTLPFECLALSEEANTELASVSVKDFLSSQMTMGANVATI